MRKEITIDQLRYVHEVLQKRRKREEEFNRTHKTKINKDNINDEFQDILNEYLEEYGENNE